MATIPEGYPSPLRIPEAYVCARCRKALTVVESSCYRCGKCQHQFCTKHRNAFARATAATKGHQCEGLAAYVAQWKQQQQTEQPPIEAPRVETL